MFSFDVSAKIKLSKPSINFVIKSKELDREKLPATPSSALLYIKRAYLQT